MSVFQNKFMSIVDEVQNTNMGLMKRFNADSGSATNNLLKEMNELRFTNANLDKLENRGRLNQYFQQIEQKYVGDLRKYALEFTHDINETFVGNDKQLRSLFTGEGISNKELYRHIDSSEDIYSVFRTKAGNLTVDLSLLGGIQERIAVNAGKVIGSMKRMKMFVGIIIPIVVIAAILIGIVMILSDNGSGVSVGVAATAGLVMIAAWAVFYRVISTSLKNKMLTNLESTTGAICNELDYYKAELSTNFSNWLENHLNEMSTMYFMKYKPLVNIVTSEGRV